MEFNQTKDTDPNRTTNHEGARAYEPDSPELALYKRTINNLLEETYYESDSESLAGLLRRFEAAAEIDPEFPLELAAYARHEAGLRDVPQVLLVAAAHHDDTREYVREYAPRVIDRADELCTVVAIQLRLFGKPIPKPLKKGVADAFHGFDRYEFAKYRNERREVSLRDVMNLVHPRPETPEEEDVFERLALGDLDDHPEVEPLEPPETWEVVISERGNTPEAWCSVLDRMGLFATVRNLRNVLEAGLDGEEVLDEDDLAYAREAKLYPFRFYQAHRALERAGIEDEHIHDWLSRAVDRTAENLPDRLADTFVAVDLSGSMRQSLSGRSSLQLDELSAFFGAVLARRGADVAAFASAFEPVSLDRERPTLELVPEIRETEVGGATNGWKVLRHLVEREATYERVVILTDMQIWDSTFGGREETVEDWWNRYRSVAPDASLYMVDLASYGDLATPEGYEDVYDVSGWNARIVDYVVYAEDAEEVLEEVREY